MNNKHTPLRIVAFILSVVAIGLLAFAMIQPVVKSTGEEKYLEYLKLFFESFQELIKSSTKDKVLGLILIVFLIATIVMGAFFTALSAIVTLISGIVSLGGKVRAKTILPVIAGGFHLAFLSLLVSFYYVDAVELEMGGLCIVIGLGVAIVAHFLEEYATSLPKPNQGRYFVASLIRTLLSGIFVYISLMCFSKLYKHNPSGTEFGQALFSTTQYNARIEEDLPKKLFAFVSAFTFALGLVINVLIPMLPAICGAKSFNQRHYMSNHSKKYIAQSIVMAILLVGLYYGTVLIDETPSDYSMGSGLLTTLILLGVVLVVGIITAIIDPKSTKFEFEGPDSGSKPQFAPQPQSNSQTSSDTPKTSDN